MSESARCAPLVEFSGGKGFHYRLILDCPIPAGQAKKMAQSHTGSVLSGSVRLQPGSFPQAGISFRERHGEPGEASFGGASRYGETLFQPAGKKDVYGGGLLGV